MRTIAMTSGIAILCSSIACLPPPPVELAVWSEFLELHEIRESFPDLAKHSADLYLAVSPDAVDEDLWQFLRDAETAGVAVRCWLQLPEDGTWLNETNVAGFCEFARTLLDEAEANGVPIEWLVLDLEPHFDYLEELRERVTDGDLGAIVSLFESHHDPEPYAEATAAIRQLVEEVQARDVQVMAVILPWTVDDLVDGDTDYQDIFDTPFVDIPWDQVSVMAYRPVFTDLLGIPLTPGFVERYARSARERFGPNAQIAIGNISTPGLLAPPGYTNPSDVLLDVSAARTVGINSYSLFSLDGMVLEGGADRWLQTAANPGLLGPYVDPFSDLFRGVLQIADVVIDD